MDKCCLCGKKANLTILPVHTVTWGALDPGIGQFTFNLYDVEFYACEDILCEGGFFTVDQAQAYNAKVNSWLKDNLGLDWLLLEEEARRRKKDE